MQVKCVVEKHADGYVAYPLGWKGVVVGEGSTSDEVLADVRSAVQSHIETFGIDVLPEGMPIEAFTDEAEHIAMRRSNPAGGSDR